MEATSPLPAGILQEAPDHFDVERLERSGLTARLLGTFSNYPYLQRVLDLARWFTPVLRIPGAGLTFVLRQQEVREVLSKSRQFPVPWGWKMKLVTTDPQRAKGHGGEGGGRNFVLGMKEPDKAYEDDYALLARAFPYDDARKCVARLAQRATEDILKDWDKNGNGEPMDVVEKLVLGVPAALCDTYYGVTVPAKERLYFAKCTLAVSSFLFGPDFKEGKSGSAKRSRDMALDAATPLRHYIRNAMNTAAAGHHDTPLQRLMAGPGGDAAVDLDRVHVQLFGMVLGFIPTNVLAAGNILETLLRQPEFMARAVAAARVGDDELLWRCLRETLRFRNINLGPLRVCAEDCDLAGTDGRSTRIKAGEKVLACTQSAMFDTRHVNHPHQFDSARPDDDYLVFGVGQHWCIGAYIAIAQITQTFKLLLANYDLKPVPGAAGRMKRFNVFPLHMRVKVTRR